MAIVKSIQEINGEQIEIFIEVDKEPLPKDPYGGTSRGVKDAVKAVEGFFSQGLTLARNCATEVIHNVNQMKEEVKPNEFEVQLAVNLNSEVGAVLAKASTGAQMQITMKWTLKKNPQS